MGICYYCSRGTSVRKQFLVLSPQAAGDGISNNGKLFSLDLVVTRCGHQISFLVIAEEHVCDDHAPDPLIGVADHLFKILEIHAEGVEDIILYLHTVGCEYFREHLPDLFYIQFVKDNVVLIDLFAVRIIGHILLSPFSSWQDPRWFQDSLVPFYHYFAESSIRFSRTGHPSVAVRNSSDTPLNCYAAFHSAAKSA